jgi:hypothetical protein
MTPWTFFSKGKEKMRPYRLTQYLGIGISAYYFINGAPLVGCNQVRAECWLLAVWGKRGSDRQI